jgi:hypothetical protein
VEVITIFKNRRWFHMSLTVPAKLLEQAKTGKVPDREFLDCIANSLPYAWGMVTRLVEELRAGKTEFVDNREVPETDDQWGQMFRMMASDSMRVAIERHFGIRLAFQNCCRVGVFVQQGADEAYDRFVSPEAQLLNQSPALLNC